MLEIRENQPMLFMSNMSSDDVKEAPPWSMSSQATIEHLPNKSTELITSFQSEPNNPMPALKPIRLGMYASGGSTVESPEKNWLVKIRAPNWLSLRGAGREGRRPPVVNAFSTSPLTPACIPLNCRR